VATIQSNVGEAISEFQTGEETCFDSVNSSSSDGAVGIVADQDSSGAK